MSDNYEEIIGAALALPPGARAMLADHLLESLDAKNQREVDASWAEEAERRVREIIEGKVSTIPADQVFGELRARNK
ncbi:MAG: addiction module protein [Blastocatellales bacterium]